MALKHGKLATFQLPVLSYTHSRPLGCQSVGTRGLYLLSLSHWKTHILGKHLTPSPSCSLSPLLSSLYGHVLFPQLLSAGCLILSSAGHTCSFDRYLFGQWENSCNFALPPLSSFGVLPSKPKTLYVLLIFSVSKIINKKRCRLECYIYR